MVDCEDKRDILIAESDVSHQKMRGYPDIMADIIVNVSED